MCNFDQEALLTQKKYYVNLHTYINKHAVKFLRIRFSCDSNRKMVTFNKVDLLCTLAFIIETHLLIVCCRTKLPNLLSRLFIVSSHVDKLKFLAFIP